MQKTDTDYKTLNKTYLSTDKYYYKYVFKKTEKIICAVFYLVSKSHTNKETDYAIKDSLITAQSVHNKVLESLNEPSHRLPVVSKALSHALLVLESKLRIAMVTDHISPEQLHVFVSEIDTTIRTLAQYAEQYNEHSRLELSESISDNTAKSSRPRKPVAQRSVSSDEITTGIPLLSRRERITQVLTSRGQASIKDISDVIKDCSEKTIQRELNTMIKDSIIVREGERRWSTYMLI